MTNKEKAHQIAWECTNHYDPICCKQEWVEMGALEMAKWKEQQMIEKMENFVKGLYLPAYPYQDRENSELIEDIKQAMKGE